VGGLPAFPVDGELWLGRGSTADEVHKAVAAGEWQRLKLVVFDIPGLRAELAIAKIRATTFTGNTIAAEFWKVKSNQDAFMARDTVVASGGEGVMLRRPGSLYRDTRTDDLLKLKPSYRKLRVQITARRVMSHNGPRGEPAGNIVPTPTGVFTRVVRPRFRLVKFTKPKRKVLSVARLRGNARG